MLFSGPALAWWDELVVLRVSHTVTADEFIVGLKLGIHKLNCSHFCEAEVTGLLLDREVHQVFPLFWDHTCGHRKASE